MLEVFILKFLYKKTSRVQLICSLGVFLYKNFEIDFSWITTFPQCVHGVYDEEMEKIQGKYSQNYGIKEIPREHSIQ